MEKEAEVQKNPVGRPKIEMTDKDFDRVCNLAEIQCTAQEIAHVMEMSIDTLERRLIERGYANFADFHKKHSDGGKVSVRRMQWQSAQKGNVAMQIWLGKQILGQADRQVVSNEYEEYEIIIGPAKEANTDRLPASGAGNLLELPSAT